MNIVYEPHPVTPERKAELRRAGYRIVDAMFAPAGYEYPEELRPEKAEDLGNETTEDQRREHLFSEIERLSGNRPGATSKTETLEAKLAELTKNQE